MVMVNCLIVERYKKDNLTKTKSQIILEYYAYQTIKIKSTDVKSVRLAHILNNGISGNNGTTHFTIFQKSHCHIRLSKLIDLLPPLSC